MNRKYLPYTVVLILLLVIISLGVLIWYPSSETKSSQADAFSPLESFEANFYGYLSQTLKEVYSEAGNNNEVSKTKIRGLTDEGLQMIADFTAENKSSLSPDDLNNLTQLRFYVYSSIAIDEPLSRTTLEELPAGKTKLPLLYSYIESFALPDTRTDTPDEVFFAYVDSQVSWAKEYAPYYQERASSLIFKAAPIGKTIPNFFKNVNDINNASLNLELFKGKYVLVDFWATWCLPCIVELPYLVEAYQRFSHKGFEIISISLDDNEKAFQNFIKDRNLTWKQYYDGKGFRGEIVQKYGVTGIPTLYLVDPQGKVIVANFNGEELIRQLEKRLKS